jgi:hypothetical protein
MCVEAFHIFATLGVHVAEPEKRQILLSMFFEKNNSREGESHGEAKGLARIIK